MHGFGTHLYPALFQFTSHAFALRPPHINLFTLTSSLSLLSIISSLSIAKETIAAPLPRKPTRRLVLNISECQTLFFTYSTNTRQLFSTPQLTTIRNERQNNHSLLSLLSQPAPTNHAECPLTHQPQNPTTERRGVSICPYSPNIVLI